MNARRGLAALLVLLGLAACGGGSAGAETAPIARSSSGWLLIKNPGDGVGSDPIVARLAPVFLPKPLQWLQRTVFTARTATPAGYTLLGRVRSDPKLGVRYLAFITMHLDRAGLPTEYSLNFTARGLTANTYAVTFRYDDVPEIPHIANPRPYESSGLDPCDVFD